MPPFARDFLPPDPLAVSAQAESIASPRTPGRPLPGHRVRFDGPEPPVIENPPGLTEQLIGMLGESLYEDRKHTLWPQRLLSSRTGIPQQNISAYERGRTTPSWPTYVRLLLAMNRVPLLTTKPSCATTSYRGSPEERLLETLVTVGDMVGERRYSIWHRAAAYLHRLPMTAERVVMQGLAVRVSGRPDRLDEFAQELCQLREIRTARGPNLRPHLSFDCAGIDVALFPYEDIGPSIEVGFDGRVFPVAPLDKVVVF